MFPKQDQKKAEILKISRYVYLQDDIPFILIICDQQSVIISNIQRAPTSQ